MIGPHEYVKRRIKKAGFPWGRPFAIALGRCARLYRATVQPSASLILFKGVLPTPVENPPVQGRCPVYPIRRAFVPSMNLLTGGDFALPTAPIEQGVPPLHPDQPCADWMPPCGARRAAASAEAIYA